MNMLKKLTAIALAFAFVLSMAACGKSSDTLTAEAKQSAEKYMAEGNAAQAANGAASVKSEEQLLEIVANQPGETQTPAETADKEADAATNTEGFANFVEEQEDSFTTKSIASPGAEYNEGVLLIKVRDTFDPSLLGKLEYTAAEPLYSGSKWYTITLADESKTAQAATYLTGLNTLAVVDYDYVLTMDGEVSAKIPAPGVVKRPAPELQSGADNGGDSRVVIAVIDSGVDYTHEDLRNNIWINNDEIPGNGKDDDNNGYVDDIYGWDCCNDDNDPWDDQGHGTHVAGIIAAEKNNIGMTGVAYNCKIMVLKAGGADGRLADSDIAEAVEYAYKNGADIINMSFGGPGLSYAAREALKSAADSCVLVAAAGNESQCNHTGCTTHRYDEHAPAPAYPAAMSEVIAVMSTDKTGRYQSYFSNFDHYATDDVEYEVYAAGEDIYSCYPNSRYVEMSGTSMACPAIAGIAALLRSVCPANAGYSVDYIRSVIVNAGTIYPDGRHPYVDVAAAFADNPGADIVGYEYVIDDSPALNPKNNGNGKIEEGETVRVHIKPRYGNALNGIMADFNAELNDFLAKAADGDLSGVEPYYKWEPSKDYIELDVPEDSPETSE